MPVEERYITFSIDEVYQAVKMRCVRENMPMPREGQPILIEMQQGDTPENVKIDLHITPDGNAEAEKQSYDRTFFALALVFFCQGCGIPLPMKGKKTLNIQPDRIIMRIELQSQNK